MVISKKISELDVLTSPQDLTKLFPPLFAQDGSPLNIRMSMAEVLKSARQVTITDATVGTSTSILSIAPTWTTNGTYAAPLLVNVTDSGTANAASKLLDLQVGGVSTVASAKRGTIHFPVTFNNITSIPAPGIANYYGLLGLYGDSGTAAASLSSVNLDLLSASGSFSINGTVVLTRDASDILALRRSTNANMIRVYETYTDSTTFSRGVFGFRDSASGGTGAGSATTVLRIGTEKGSVGGTARDFAIITDGTVRVTFAAAGGQTAAEGHNMAFGTSTGTKIGTATGQKIGFWNATPVVQQVLATGAGATVDNVITLLQTLGLCKQS